MVRISSKTPGPEGTAKFSTLSRASVARGYVRWRYEGDGVGGEESDRIKTRGRLGMWRLLNVKLAVVYWVARRKGREGGIFVSFFSGKMEIPAYIKQILYNNRIELLEIVKEHCELGRRAGF